MHMVRWETQDTLVEVWVLHRLSLHLQHVVCLSQWPVALQPRTESAAPSPQGHALNPLPCALETQPV